VPCIDVNLYGGHDVEKLVLDSMQTVSRDITATLAGVLWHLTDIARDSTVAKELSWSAAAPFLWSSEPGL
jgi:hypothetical protein